MLGSVVKPALSVPRNYPDVSNWKVRVGSDKLSSSPSLPVAKIFTTEQSTLYPKEKDIALVKLEYPLTFSGERSYLGPEP